MLKDASKPHNASKKRSSRAKRPLRAGPISPCQASAGHAIESCRTQAAISGKEMSGAGGPPLREDQVKRLRRRKAWSDCGPEASIQSRARPNGRGVGAEASRSSWVRRRSRGKGGAGRSSWGPTRTIPNSSEGAGGGADASCGFACEGSRFRSSPSGDAEGGWKSGSGRVTRRASSRARAEDSAVKPGRRGTRAARTS